MRKDSVINFLNLLVLIRPKKSLRGSHLIAGVDPVIPPRPYLGRRRRKQGAVS